MYTLGSPLALWSLRFPHFGIPIKVPSPGLLQHHRTLAGEWLNVYDKDDLVGYPLRGLGSAYAAAVTADVEVKLHGFLVAQTPLVHPWYWNDYRVLDPIAKSLANTWRELNGSTIPSRP